MEKPVAVKSAAPARSPGRKEFHFAQKRATGMATPWICWITKPTINLTATPAWEKRGDARLASRSRSGKKQAPSELR